VDNAFSHDFKYFHNLTVEEQNQFLDYKIMVYLCEGPEREKLDWFKVINIAGEKLTDQELLNAVYTGTWVTDAKKYFSKTGCNAYNIGSYYLNGVANRQDYLETVIDWISDGAIGEYMAVHQHDSDAKPLWAYFQAVIEWVEATFPTKRKFMKGIAWGELYNAYKAEVLDPILLELDITRLVADDDVTKKSGIYPYLLTGNSKYLSLRAFSDNTKQKMYEKQAGICPACSKHFEIEEMEADHITPWSQGGTTIESNCQMLCKNDNRTKSGK
jgi:hypothetical protein